jgi:hypothetical protein
VSVFLVSWALVFDMKQGSRNDKSRIFFIIIDM